MTMELLKSVKSEERGKFERKEKAIRSHNSRHCEYQK